MRRWSKWKPTLPTACLISISSDCPTPKLKKAATAYEPPSSKAVSNSPPKKSPSTSPPPTCPKNRDVSTCRLRWASSPHPDKSHPKSSPSTSLPANWRFPACCAPCAARWRWRGRACRRGVLSFCRKKTQNKPPSCAALPFTARVR